MDPEDDLFENVTYLEEECEEEEVETPEQTANLEVKLCVVCTVQEPNILLLPCKHMKICSECVLKLQANAIAKEHEKFECPVCRQAVIDTIQVFL